MKKYLTLIILLLSVACDDADNRDAEFADAYNAVALSYVENLNVSTGAPENINETFVSGVDSLTKAYIFTGAISGDLSNVALFAQLFGLYAIKFENFTRLHGNAYADYLANLDRAGNARNSQMAKMYTTLCIDRLETASAFVDSARFYLAKMQDCAAKSNLYFYRYKRDNPNAQRLQPLPFPANVYRFNAARKTLVDKYHIEKQKQSFAAALDAL